MNLRFDKDEYFESKWERFLKELEKKNPSREHFDALSQDDLREAFLEIAREIFSEV